MSNNRNGPMWRYIDQEGETQGPFPIDKMAAWTKAGYFVAETKVQTVGEGEFVMMSMHPMCTFKVLIPGYTAPAPTAPVVPASFVAERKMDHGKTDQEVLAEEKQVKPSEEKHEEEVANKWFYLDDEGQPQGPFEDDDMREWFAAQYFNDETK